MDSRLAEQFAYKMYATAYLFVLLFVMYIEHWAQQIRLMMSMTWEGYLALGPAHKALMEQVWQAAWTSALQKLGVYWLH